MPLVVAAAAAVLLGALTTSTLKFSPLRWLDQWLLKEQLKDAWGYWLYQEDWDAQAPLPASLDYTWLESADRPILIAHALGEATLSGQNTLAAMQRSLARGLRLLEIDVWLDDAGYLRCHHGPALPPAITPGDCTLGAALALAATANAWLVLDIKSDFAATGESIVAHSSRTGDASRLVFQLYRPADLPLFSAWSRRLPLPGPIVTAYLSRRSLAYVARQASRIGARALTVPLYRIGALGPVSTGLVVLTHPVHDCTEAAKALRLHAGGLYAHNTLVSDGRLECSP